EDAVGRPTGAHDIGHRPPSAPRERGCHGRARRASSLAISNRRRRAGCNFWQDVGPGGHLDAGNLTSEGNVTSVETKTSIPPNRDSSILSRLLDEGYGPGAWHGADLRAAVADVSDTTAFWRPPSRPPNLADIDLH